MRRKVILIMMMIGAIILATEVSLGYFFPKLTFVNGIMIIVSRIIGYLAFSSFILCVLVLFKANKILTIPLGLILFSFFFINSCAEIYPIDTTTQPRDISVLRTSDDGNKLVIREYKNVKTNEIIRDTVLVKDNFIFRRILER